MVGFQIFRFFCGEESREPWEDEGNCLKKSQFWRKSDGNCKMIPLSDNAAAASKLSCRALVMDFYISLICLINDARLWIRYSFWEKNSKLFGVITDPSFICLKKGLKIDTE